MKEATLPSAQTFTLISPRPSGYRVRSEGSVGSALVSVTAAAGQMEGVYNFGDFALCFQDALKAFQMCPHSYALSHMLLHDYFEKYIIVKKFGFHCIMHELVIFILRMVFIPTS